MLNSDESWVMSSTRLSWFVLVSQINLSVGREETKKQLGGAVEEKMLSRIFFFFEYRWQISASNLH